MSKWQKIETAPKDGSHFLAWDGQNISVVAWKQFWCCMASGREVFDRDGMTSPYSHVRNIKPIYWMPLSEPPDD